MKVFACHVCGATGAGTALHRQNRTGKPGIWACGAHFSRTKCSIDGCARTRDRDKAGQEWICGEHWRRYVPPRSRRRRTYHGFFREAKRSGWTDDSYARFWRFWDLIVASANARHAAGTVDVAAIHKFMGWDDGEDA